MQRCVSVVVAEPNLLLCEKTAGLVARYDRVWCVAQVCEATGLVRAVAALRPELVLVDITLLRQVGAAGLLRQASPLSRIIVVLEALTEPYVSAARRMGADAVLEKAHVGENIQDQIRVVLSQEQPQGALA